MAFEILFIALASQRYPCFIFAALEHHDYAAWNVDSAAQSRFQHTLAEIVGGPEETFPTTLYSILYDSELRDHAHWSIIGWQFHGRAFQIRNTDLLEQMVLSKYDNCLGYGAFLQNLAIFGFRQLTRGPDTGCYFHECLLRGRPDLCQLIRRKQNGQTLAELHDPASEPNLASYPPLYPANWGLTTSPPDAVDLGTVAPPAKQSAGPKTTGLDGETNESTPNDSKPAVKGTRNAGARSRDGKRGSQRKPRDDTRGSQKKRRRAVQAPSKSSLPSNPLVVVVSPSVSACEMEAAHAILQLPQTNALPETDQTVVDNSQKAAEAARKILGVLNAFGINQSTLNLDPSPPAAPGLPANDPPNPNAATEAATNSLLFQQVAQALHGYVAPITEATPNTLLQIQHMSQPPQTATTWPVACSNPVAVLFQPNQPMVHMQATLDPTFAVPNPDAVIEAATNAYLVQQIQAMVVHCTNQAMAIEANDANIRHLRSLVNTGIQQEGIYHPATESVNHGVDNVTNNAEV